MPSSTTWRATRPGGRGFTSPPGSPSHPLPRVRQGRRTPPRTLPSPRPGGCRRSRSGSAARSASWRRSRTSSPTLRCSSPASRIPTPGHTRRTRACTSATSSAPASPRRCCSTASGRPASSTQLVEVRGEHPPPGGPVVLDFRTPRVDPVGNALATQHVGHRPGLTDVLPGTLTGGEDHLPLPELVELGSLEAGQEVQRRGEEEVLARLLVQESL